MIYAQALKFYLELVGNFPPRYSILICNEETTYEELLAFIYLSSMCKFHSLFLILKPDKLQLSLRILLQEKIEDIIYDVKNKKSEIKSLIIILFDDIGKSDIGKELIRIKFIKNIEEPNVSLPIINNIEIVSSYVAGHGKSVYIKQKFEEEFKNDISSNKFK